MKKCLLMLTGLAMAAGMLFAQPANDQCANAIELSIYNSEAEAVPVEGTTVGTIDGALDGIPVCSGNFFRDDVWYYVTTPDVVSESGYAIRVYTNEQAADMPAFGLALYNSCEAIAENEPFFCGNADSQVFYWDEQGIGCFNPKSTVYIRVWSAAGDAANWETGEGTFRISIFPRAFEGTPDSELTVLWGNEPGQGDFDGGLNDWTAVGISCNGTGPENALWEWTDSGWPNWLWGGNSISRIKSKTFCNGAMLFESMLLDIGFDNVPGSGTCPQDHQGALVSPVIDLSGFTSPGISVLFNQSMQRFSGGVHFLDYSTNGGATWDSIQINNDKTYLSNNPDTGDGYYNEEMRVRIPGAQNASELQIRFRFRGSAYWWIVDDVKIIETEANNVRIDMPFVTVPLPVQTVVDQGIPWLPQVDIKNIGALDQSNVTLRAVVQNMQGTVVYDESVNFGVLQADSSITNLASTFTVPYDFSMAIGSYTGTYTLVSDESTLETDFDPADNIATFEAYVDENTFALERGVEGSVTGASTNWDPGVNRSFIFGNYFHTPQGSLRRFVSGTFGLGNVNELQGVEISFVLFRWNNGLQDETCQATERTFVGFATYTPGAGDGGADGDTIITLTFDNLLSAGPILLEDNTSYILAIQFDATDTNMDLNVLTAESIDYGQTIQQFVQQKNPHFGGVLAVPREDGINEGIDIGTDTYGDGSSARSIVPVVRMNTSDVLIAVKDPLPENNLVTLYPNPVQDILIVEMELEKQYDRVNLEIINLDGKKIGERTLRNVQNEKTDMNVSRLPAGTYILHIRTDAGNRFMPFIVQR